MKTFGAHMRMGQGNKGVKKLFRHFEEAITIICQFFKFVAILSKLKNALLVLKTTKLLTALLTIHE